MKRHLLWLPVALSIAGCFQDLSTDPPLAAKEIEHVTAPAVQVSAGDEGPVPTVRLVEQASREPIANETVEFLLRPQSGSIANLVTRTDANGIASGGKWTLPVQAGEAILDVRAAGISVSFVATVKPGAPVALKAMDTTIAWIAGELAPAPIVAVVDRFGNPIDGAGLTFAIVRGGGELPRNEVISANGGKATPGRWRLGTAAGENEIRVTYAGLAPLNIKTLGLDRTTIVWYDLETAGGSPVPSSAVEKGALGFTKFNPCLCAGEDGYFLMDLVQAAGLLGQGAQSVGLSGRYKIQSQQVQLLGEGNETRGANEGSTVIYLVRDQLRPIELGRIRLDVSRLFQASGLWFNTIWVFKETGQ